jgi:hypothetical protein
MAYLKLENGLKYIIIIRLFWCLVNGWTGLEIYAKRICDRSSIFEIIDEKACRSYGEQDSSIHRGP